MVDFRGFVVHLEDTGWSIAGLPECGLEELLVNVDAMEIVIVLLLLVWNHRACYRGAYRAKLGLVVSQWIRALYCTVGPVVHDQLLEDHLLCC